jgi:hypothetical protein
MTAKNKQRQKQEQTKDTGENKQKATAKQIRAATVTNTT